MFIQIDFLAEMKQYGGYVGYLCLVVVVVLWNKLSAKDAEIQRINGERATDAINNMAITTKISAFIEHLVAESSKSEGRLAEIIRNEGDATRELLLMYSENAKETLKKTGSTDDGATD